MQTQTQTLFEWGLKSIKNLNNTALLLLLLLDSDNACLCVSKDNCLYVFLSNLKRYFIEKLKLCHHVLTFEFE